LLQRNIFGGFFCKKSRSIIVLVFLLFLGYVNFNYVNKLYLHNILSLISTQQWVKICLDEDLSGEQRLELLHFSEPLEYWNATDGDFAARAFATAPLNVVTDTQLMQAELIASQMDTCLCELREDHIVIYSWGGIEIPLLLDSSSKVMISVRAIHDAPPPVTLTLFLDDSFVGNLEYARGDDTWGTDNILLSMTGGCHWLSVWYRHDFYDKERQLDRNAYIDWIEVRKLDYEFSNDTFP
jgi:hypothetical protein